MVEASRRASIPTMGGTIYLLRMHAYRYGRQPKNLNMAQRRAIREKNWEGVMNYNNALAGTADPQHVLDWYESIMSQLTNPRARMVMNQTCVELFMLLGLEAKAFEVLSDCARNGLIDILWIDRCPLLARLRSVDGFGEVRDWVWLNAYGVWN
jgi:hypothetical protein